MESEMNALRSAGLDVELFAARTDELKGDRLYPVRTAARVATGQGRSPLKAIDAFNPDIVHIHNLFPNFGRKWVRALGVPVVHTLHNYRPLCANAILFRDGHICTDCPDGRRWSGLRHACYRGSRLATLPIAWANRRGPMADPLIRHANRLIMLSEQQRGIYSSAGTPPEKMLVWPNFLPDELDPGALPITKREGWLFVGRLSEEKGISRLVALWPDNEPLSIVGSGPLRAVIEASATGKEIHFHGLLPRQQVLQMMRAARGLVFPSLWPEAFPLVYLEALASALPILAFEGNVVADFIRDSGIGHIAKWNAPLRDLLDEAKSLDLSHACRALFEQTLSESGYRERAISLYRCLVGSNSQAQRDTRSVNDSKDFSAR